MKEEPSGRLRTSSRPTLLTELNRILVYWFTCLKQEGVIKSHINSILKQHSLLTGFIIYFYCCVSRPLINITSEPKNQENVIISVNLKIRANKSLSRLYSLSLCRNIPTLQLICTHPVGKINKKHYVAWIHTKSKLFHSDFLLILPSGQHIQHFV